ncbi:hypothetical protein QVD17_19118 [Tagetes erecta]|uniref:Uncharacterized protein n=1 Tax=Tagetes erecta TaxID=13708 RepID=A0AAD8KIY2_TARER|nr:hypothetical protein QVD17_19118 [Tagetes erecta]
MFVEIQSKVINLYKLQAWEYGNRIYKDGQELPHVDDSIDSLDKIFRKIVPPQPLFHVFWVPVQFRLLRSFGLVYDSPRPSDL